MSSHRHSKSHNRRRHRPNERTKDRPAKSLPPSMYRDPQIEHCEATIAPHAEVASTKLPNPDATQPERTSPEPIRVARPESTKGVAEVPSDPAAQPRPSLRQGVPPEPDTNSLDTNPLDTSHGAKRSRKLDAAMKTEICQLVAEGHTLAAAAEIVGISERTIRRERDRDPFFGQQLRQDKHRIARICFKSMETDAATKSTAAERLFKLVYPERYYARPHMISIKKHEKGLTELVRLFASIATPKQMQELDRLLGPEGASKC